MPQLPDVEPTVSCTVGSVNRAQAAPRVTAGVRRPSSRMPVSGAVPGRTLPLLMLALALLGLLVVNRMQLIVSAWLVNTSYPALVRATDRARSLNQAQCQVQPDAEGALPIARQAVSIAPVRAESWMALARANWLTANCN